jgi:hypothetical protein
MEIIKLKKASFKTRQIMENSTKVAALAGCQVSQKAWLDAEIKELLLEDQDSANYACEYLDLLGLFVMFDYPIGDVNWGEVPNCLGPVGVRDIYLFWRRKQLRRGRDPITEDQLFEISSKILRHLFADKT